MQVLAEAAQRKVNQIPWLPRREEWLTLLKRLNQGVTIALGHSNATYEEAMAAVEAGASSLEFTSTMECVALVTVAWYGWCSL